MREYIVRITIPNHDIEIRTTCSSFSAAASNAIREMRKQIKGVRLKSMKLELISAGPAEKPDNTTWPTEKDIAEAPTYQPSMTLVTHNPETGKLEIAA